MDSGATHSFISQATVDRMKLKLKTHKRLRITVADGKSFKCNSVVSIVLLFGTGMGNGCLQLPVDRYVSQDLSSEVILGVNWLETHNPVIDWVACTIKFPCNAN